VPRRAIGAADSHPLSARRFAPVHQAAEADVVRPRQACGSCRRLSAAPLGAQEKSALTPGASRVILSV
jgi:hypothetical protein